MAACKQLEVNDIFIGITLFNNQSYGSNYQLQQLIKKSLSKDADAFSKLNSFVCNEVEECKDFGFIISQIVHKLGDQNTALMVQKMDKIKRVRLSEYLALGLKYGDQDRDELPDNKQVAETFPEVYKLISIP